jgi:hypothetical protein
MFESEKESFKEINAEKQGYTHLIAGAKKNPLIDECLEQRVRREYPGKYHTVKSYLA